ncbi:MAG TPA: peptidoglycan-associated lipoprotein Pal [Casimicrobiaceae bacterium]|nr:peptidoglycan-associated lipoprotein Pal [Casimicrobiaceae bacterium]
MLIAGCQTQPSQEAPIDDRSAQSGAPSTTPGASTAGTGSGGVTGSSVPSGAGPGSGALGAGALRDPNNILSRRSVFFDFDSIVVKDEYRPMIEAHARYLSTNRGARATIQGHTDERGSREYNIALGQRRADAIKRMMTLVGAQDGQVETVSFGKEKPRNPGHDEAAWAQNRRGDIVHQGE